MPAIRYEWNINSVINTVLLLVAIGVGWGTLNNEITQQGRRIGVLEQSVATDSTRVRNLEISQASTASDVRSIWAGISRIESKLDGLGQRP